MQIKLYGLFVYLSMLVTEIQLYEALKEKVGEVQARAITEYVEAKFESKKDSLATKQDLNNAVADLKVEIIASKIDIIRWMIISFIGAAGVIVAAIKLL